MRHRTSNEGGWEKHLLGETAPDTVDEKTKNLLGVDTELHKPGDDQQKTDDRKQALAILEEPENRWLNARQMLL